MSYVGGVWDVVRWSTTDESPATEVTAASDDAAAAAAAATAVEVAAVLVSGGVGGRYPPERRYWETAQLWLEAEGRFQAT